VDAAALDRAKREQASYHRGGLMSRSMGLLKGGPDVSHAAHFGQPTMTNPKPTIPASVPVVNNGADTAANVGGAGNMDVSAQQITGKSALDEKPDARTAATGTNGTTPDATAAKPAGEDAAAQTQPLPTNRDAELKKLRDKQAKKQAKMDKKKKKVEEPGTAQPASASPQTQSSQGAQTPTGTPNPVTQPAGTNATNPTGRP
jgi:hypothetical protein